MAANWNRSMYLAAFIAAFIMALVALLEGAIALSSHPIIGVLLGLGGQALLILSLVGFYRVRSMGFKNE